MLVSHSVEIVVALCLIISAFIGGQYIGQCQFALAQPEQHTKHAHLVAGAVPEQVLAPRQKPLLKVPFPAVKPGLQENDNDGVPRLFTTDPSYKVEQHEEWNQDNGKWPTCSGNLDITVNGQKVAFDSMWPALDTKDGPEIITVRVNGECGPFTGQTSYYLRKGRSDVKVWWQVLAQDTFYFTRRMFNTDSVSRIIDLGTNIGMSVVYWASHYPNAQVIGVEPELHNFGMAVFNAGHRQNVFLERAAVTTRNGWSKKSSIGDHLDWAYTEQPAEGLETADGFKAITMTHLLDKYKWDFVDILKIDVEGAETQLCKDILDGAEWINRVRCVTMETHGEEAMNVCAQALQKAKFKFLGHFQIDNIFAWCRDESHPFQPANRRLGRRTLS